MNQFNNETERQAWVRFAASDLGRSQSTVRDAAARADKMLEEMRKRCPDRWPSTRDSLCKGPPP